MPEAALVDNDVLLKACRYLLVADVLDFLGTLGRPAILGSARFVLRHSLGRVAGGRGGLPLAQVDVVLRSTTTMEPDEEEVALAADFQEEAQSRDLALDAGEGLLLAMLLLRPAACLATGDKRAIAAAGAVVSGRPPIGRSRGRLLCFEQVMMGVMGALGHLELRGRVCAAPDADRALATCFGCGASTRDCVETRAGLRSYADDVIASAPALLMTMDELSSILPDEHGVGPA